MASIVDPHPKDIFGCQCQCHLLWNHCTTRFVYRVRHSCGIFRPTHRSSLSGLVSRSRVDHVDFGHKIRSLGLQSHLRFVSVGLGWVPCSGPVIPNLRSYDWSPIGVGSMGSEAPGRPRSRSRWPTGDRPGDLLRPLRTWPSLRSRRSRLGKKLPVRHCASFSSRGLQDRTAKLLRRRTRSKARSWWPLGWAVEDAAGGGSNPERSKDNHQQVSVFQTSWNIEVLFRNFQWSSAIMQDDALNIHSKWLNNTHTVESKLYHRSLVALAPTRAAWWACCDKAGRCNLHSANRWWYWGDPLLQNEQPAGGSVDVGLETSNLVHIWGIHTMATT